MRQLFLDTETTGLSAEGGDRVIELGCVELVNRKLTGNNLHFYFNPGRDSHEDALKVHGISNEFLRDKPKFAQVADEVLAFIEDAELIIHNAPFDVGFIDHELGLLGGGTRRIVEICSVIDTLAMARERFPGQRNSLDALCKRLDVNNNHRTLHGALLDAELLSDVYLAMTAGQGDLGLSNIETPIERSSIQLGSHTPVSHKVLLASAEEQGLHLARLEKIAKKSGGRLQWPS